MKKILSFLVIALAVIVGAQTVGARIYNPPASGISALTPWTSAIDGAGYALSNVGNIVATYFTATSTITASSFKNASTTNFSNIGIAYFGGTATTTISSAGIISAIGITATNATSTGTQTIPVSASLITPVSGNIGIDSTSGQLRAHDGAEVEVYGNGLQYMGFTYATSTAWSATTTIPLGTARIGETWKDVQCFTDVGTLNIDFEHTATYITPRLMNASTTVGTYTFSGSNTLTAGEKRYVDIGTPASSPTTISCTISKSITAD